MEKHLIFIIVYVFFSLSLVAQKEEDKSSLFKGGIVAGFNAAQLDGDQFRGYSKLGLHAGIKVKYRIKEKMALHMEMLYSMRGSSEKLKKSSNGNVQTRIKLDYVEIPLLFSYKEWKIDFHSGVSFGRLIRSSTNDFSSFTSESFRKNEISIILGATYLFNEHFGGTLRFARSVTNALKNDVNADALLGHLLTFRVEYYF